MVDSLAGEEAASSPAISDASQKYETLAVTNAGGVFSITLNRPKKKNAINIQMYEDLISSLKEAGEDKSVVMATVTGVNSGHLIMHYILKLSIDHLFISNLFLTDKMPIPVKLCHRII